MTLIAGVVWASSDRSQRAGIEDRLSSLLSRRTGESIAKFHFADALLLKVDVGAYDEPGVYSHDDGSITLLTGDPVLPLGAAVAGRIAASSAIGRAVRDSDPAPLLAARGVFAGCHYDPAKGELSLFADRLGVRPLYYRTTPEYTVFASTLRALEALELPDCKMDLIGVTEIIALGTPLGTRTGYAHISAIDAAEIITIGRMPIRRTCYWRWNDVPEAGEAATEGLANELFEAFMSGIRLRVGTDRTTAAFLSGGLDSRCVVAGLKDLGVNVNTFLFGSELGEEHYCATQFATAIGVRHRVVSDSTFPPKWGAMIARAWEAAEYGRPDRAEHPQLIWSGDGGSVGLGWVYMSPSLAELLRRGDRKGAIEEYLSKYAGSIPPRLVKRAVRSVIDACVRQDIARELDLVPCADPARSFYFFLLLNDQRRHLASYYEDIDLHRIEYQLPFFDWHFLTIAASIPANLGMLHVFYNNWLKKFAPAVTTVPWQAYPGHVPSTQPIPKGLAYQWDPNVHKARAKRLRSSFTRQALSTLFGRTFPAEIVRRGSLAFVAATHAVGVRNYDYIIRAAAMYSHYWSSSRNGYTVDTPSRAGLLPRESIGASAAQGFPG